MEVAVLPIIASLVYFCVFVYKQIFVTEKALRFIPVFAGILGLILGVIIFYVAPELINAVTVFNAALIGGISGLSAVGINQIFKQATKKDPE